MFSMPMILLLMTVLMYVSTPVQFDLHLSPIAVIAIVILSHAAIAAAVWYRALRASWTIHTPGASPNAAAQGIDRLIDLARWATVILTPLLLCCLGWGSLIVGKRHPDPGVDPGWELGRFFFVPQLIFLAPGILSWLCFWAAGHRIEKAMRQRTLAFRLERRIPVHEVPSLAAYIWMQLRHNCIILIPVTLAALLEEIFKHYLDKYAILGWLLAAIVFTKMVVFLPWLTTRLWDTTPLTGPLRLRLDAIARDHRLRFRNILLWKSHHMVSNAAILGFFPLVRYFLLSDALLERLTDRQIEAVFAHEVGHGKHRHFWWFAAVLGGAIMLADGLGTGFMLLDSHFHWLSALDDNGRENVNSILQLGLAGIILFFVFLPVSKQFEHQADWFAVRHLASHAPAPRPPEAGVIMSLDQFVTLELGATYDPNAPAPPIYISTAPAPAGQATQLTAGAETFAGALFEIVDLSHRSRDSGGPFHPSPNRRANLLYAMATNPFIARQFEKRMLTIRLLIALLFVAGVAGVILDLKTSP